MHYALIQSTTRVLVVLLGGDIIIVRTLPLFSKSEAKTPKLVECDFGFGLEIKLVACLK